LPTRQFGPDESTLKIHVLGGLINIDGAKYHLRCVNPSPTISWKRPAMIDWLHEHHPGVLSPADEADWKPEGKGGKSKKDLMVVIEPLKPAKIYAAYEIAAHYGHKVRLPSAPLVSHQSWSCALMQLRITPSYCARSAPIEVGWANLKNPISMVQTKSMAELEQQIAKVVKHKITEKMWLGAYRTTRLWEDKMWVCV